MKKELSSKPLNGQQSIFDFQPSVDPYHKTFEEIAGKKQMRNEIPEEFGAFVGKCEFCMWGSNEEECYFSVKSAKRDTYKSCDENHSFWKPDSYKIPGLCGDCKHCNDFVYTVKEKYREEVEKKGYSRKAADDPEENNTIYCTKTGGPVNRIRPYIEFCDDGFGVGKYHRQHEWDSCDCWEKRR